MRTSAILGTRNSGHCVAAMFLSIKIQTKTYITRKTILLFFLSILTNQTFPQNYNFRNFNSEEGLTQSFIYSINQDSRGYLWVGTGNGLFRYNGFIFENYTTSDSLADNFISCSISDGECLWFGHNNGRLTYYNGKKFLPVAITIPNLSAITHLAKSPEGQIWASSYSDGLLKLGKDTSLIKYYRFNNQTFIITFDFLDNGELLVGTNTGLLYCRLGKSGEIEIIRSIKEIPESKVTCIQKTRNKTGFYISTENDGIFHLTNKDAQFKVLKIIAEPDFDFIGIQNICEDNQSNLWIGSFGSGLIKLLHSPSGEFRKIPAFNKTNRFVTDNVKTVYEDLEGNIWSGNYGEGLTQITLKTFSAFTFDKQIYGNDVFSIFISKQYRWLGTENGLLKMDQLSDKIVKFYSTSSGLPKDTITTIYSADGKELWIGTEKNGVYRMETENEKILKFHLKDGALENSINIITGKGKQVWIGTKKGLCNINSVTNAVIWYTINQGGLPHNYINCLYMDKTNRLWVTTLSNVLAYIQDEKVFKIPINPGNGILTLGPISEDADSRIWVGTKGNGVFRIETDSVASLSTKDGLLSDYCYSLFYDENKNIWVGHKSGLSRIRTTDFSVKPIQHIETLTDSYQFNPNAIIKDLRGIIWFGSDKGLISYDPSMEDSRLLPPVLVITSIRINDLDKKIADKIILAPGEYKIRIDFLGISLKEPTLVTYQYKLEGYDQWSDITKNTFSTFNHVTKGNYTFILKASSGDGMVTGNPVTINFLIKKSIWEKWWFYFMIIFLLITLIFIYIKRREYTFLVEKRVLEEKVRERTYEIQLQKNEIELQRDMIDEKNTNITSSIRYASHIQNAVLPPIELLNKLLPDNFIFSKPKDIVSGDFYWLAKKNNNIIFAVADCTGHGVPGAFMSLLGITLLNEIVNIQGITKSDVIVTKLRERVIHTLQQSRKDIPTTDGMDIALCVMDLHKKRIQYTGAMNNLVYIRDRKLEVVKADRLSVCAFYNITGSFTMKEIDCRKGDVLYLFSDGYQDQFGGDLDKKYLRHYFYLTLLEIHELPMFKQKEILEKKLSEWTKNKIQTDDITIMGIRL
jgi:ligand-binding sensor domain-containing protein/serine phosphatase RsbU (regulator of sigma subunit)